MVHAVLFSFSRGGMLGLIVLGLAAFAVLPKGPKELSALVLAALVVLLLAGPEVWTRFQSTFAEEKQRDSSAESRLELWAACWDTMQKYPVFGAGPDHMPLRMEQYGFPKGKESHTLWLNVGAELGFPAMLLLISYYGICLIRLVPIARRKAPVSDPWLTYLARMVIASLCGFAVSAQFVSLDFLETPYYIALIGAGVLMLSTPSSRSYQEPRVLLAGIDWLSRRLRIPCLIVILGIHTANHFAAYKPTSARACSLPSAWESLTSRTVDN
jgi:O-antigen ligase